jgi:hypothetical protein
MIRSVSTVLSWLRRAFILTLGLIFGSTTTQATPKPLSPTLSERVAAVRKCVTQNRDHSFVPQDKASASGEETAGPQWGNQWANWNNWGNWGNWHDWNQWQNFSNWGNR